MYETIDAVVRQGIEKAEHDLRNAQHTLTLGEDCPFDTVCFHAQPCAEKYLKALLTLQKIDFPKTHDLTALLALLPQPARPSVELDEVAEINPYSVEARYPGDWEPLNRAEAVRALEIALKVRQGVRDLLPAHLLAPRFGG